MAAHVPNARFAATLAAVLALFTTGVVAGAAGSALIIGSEANNAGSANTQLLTSSNVVAFKLLQNGPGTALMGYVTPGTGTTRGVYGRTDSRDGDGVQARNGAAGAGTGAAFHAYGQANTGAIVESTGKVPLQLIAPGGLAPMVVNSQTKISNLNADLLDGMNASQFHRSDVAYAYRYGCAGNAMTPQSSTVAWASDSNSIWASGTTDVTFRCNVALPNNATVTSVSWRVEDSAASDAVVCSLYWQNDFSIFQMASGSTTDAATPGVTTLTDATIGDAIINNSANAYAAYCTLEANTNLTSLFRISIAYTVASP